MDSHSFGQTTKENTKKRRRRRREEDGEVFIATTTTAQHTQQRQRHESAERWSREAKSLNSRDQRTADHERKFINAKLVHTLRVSAATGRPAGWPLMPFAIQKMFGGMRNVRGQASTDKMRTKKKRREERHETGNETVDRVG